MKIKIFLITLLISVSCFAQKKEMLFNGKNLKGWTIYVKDNAVAPEKFFYVNDGVIETIGVPMGYLRSQKEYANYILHVEWRYPEKPTNSGVFIHTNGPDGIWPSHYQCQLKHGDAGDFILNGVDLKANAGDSIYIGTEKVKPIAKRLKASSDKGTGEWNSYDIVCKGNTVEITVNGVLQNTITNCSATKGNIGLQAEGSKIQFRNIYIEKIK